MNMYTARSADEAWRAAASDLIDRHQTRTAQSRAGQTVELLHVALSIENPRARWVASRRPALNVAFALAEVIQLLAGEDDVAFLEHWFSKYAKYVGGGPTAPGAYGARLRRRWGVDQIDKAALALEANNDSRQVVLSIWNPSDDLPAADGKPRSGDVPCNVLCCLRIAEGKLHWLQTCRSNDIFRGFPHNVVQFSYLQEVMAGWIGVDVGSYTHIASSWHAYETALKEFSVDKCVVGVPDGRDIRMRRRESQQAWARLLALVRALIEPPSGKPQLPTRRAASDLGPLEHIYWIMVAEDARRRQWSDESRLAVELCADDSLRCMWTLWEGRACNLAKSTDST